MHIVSSSSCIRPARTRKRLRSLHSTKGTKTLSTSSQQVNYQLDAAGNLTSDGLRTFAYDATNRHSQTAVSKDGEASKITYLHNALGQRVFKSEPQTAQTLPNETVLGTTFTDWLKKNFSWLYATAQTNATLGNSYVYADGELPSYALLGEYGNGGTTSTGRTEYLWLPTDSGQAIPVGLFRGNRFYAVHADHLNTPRLINDDSNKAVWQWPYSAFGDNQPVGILKATTNPANAYTQDPTTNARLQATGAAITYNLRYPGQYSDTESGMFYNTQRSYSASQGRYTQNDPIGLAGGWSRYGYASANSLRFIDPTGEVFWVPIVAAAVIGGGFGAGSAYLAGGNPYIGAAVGAVGGAVGGIPAATIAGTVALGSIGGAIGGTAGAISRGQIPSGQEVLIGTIAGAAGGSTASAITAVTRAPGLSQGVGAMPAGLADLYNGAEGKRLADLELARRNRYMCPR
jgi:RHS repeat-associated protein